MGFFSSNNNNFSTSNGILVNNETQENIKKEREKKIKGLKDKISNLECEKTRLGSSTSKSDRNKYKDIKSEISLLKNELSNL